MADIVDPVALSFTNSDIRPICENIRALKATIDDITIRWFIHVSTLIPNDSSPIVDSSGYTSLVGLDINAVVTQLLEIQTVLNDTGVPAVIAKPCIRPLEAN